jgi:hypothetical protein
MTDKERMSLAKQFEGAISKAKTREQVQAAWTDKEYGYLVLGHRVLGRILAGKKAEDAFGRGGASKD